MVDVRFSKDVFIQGYAKISKLISGSELKLLQDEAVKLLTSRYYIHLPMQIFTKNIKLKIPLL